MHIQGKVQVQAKVNVNVNGHAQVKGNFLRCMVRLRATQRLHIKLRQR